MTFYIIAYVLFRVMPHEIQDIPVTRSDDLAAFQAAFGRVIAMHESEIAMSQRAFARRADISNNHLREIERGERNLKMQTVLKLAIALGTSPSRLLMETEQLLGWE